MARARISAARRFERALDARHELAREGLVGGKGGGIWDGRGGGGGIGYLSATCRSLVFVPHVATSA